MRNLLFTALTLLLVSCTTTDPADTRVAAGPGPEAPTLPDEMIVDAALRSVTVAAGPCGDGDPEMHLTLSQLPGEAPVIVEAPPTWACPPVELDNELGAWRLDCVEQNEVGWATAEFVLPWDAGGTLTWTIGTDSGSLCLFDYDLTR